jgi:membrane-bound lytic murein transglycosylase B
VVPEITSVPAIRAGLAAALLIGVGLGSAAAQTAPCRTSGSYESWLAAFEREAVAKGISQRAIAAAAPALTYDQRIVNIDRGQRVFTQTFLQFSGRMAAAYRIQRGQALIKSNAPTFARIEQQYGVPAPVIVSFCLAGL